MILTLVILSGLLLSCVHFIETIGYYFRGAGQRFQMASVGYSIHVQVATLSRLCSFMALPIVGWLLDQKVSPSYILILALISSSSFIVLSTLVSFFKNKNHYLDRLFLFLVRYVSRLKITPSVSQSFQGEKLLKSDLLTIRFSAFSSFFLISSGMYFTFFIASLIPHYRATILQLSPIVTGLGTIIAVVFFDPKISALIDGGCDHDHIFNLILKSRIEAMCLMMLIVLILFIVA
jgi:hypothetical protein